MSLGIRFVRVPVRGGPFTFRNKCVLTGNWKNGCFVSGELKTPTTIQGKNTFYFHSPEVTKTYPSNNFYHQADQFFCRTDQFGINICNKNAALFEGKINSSFKVSGLGFRYYSLCRYSEHEYLESKPFGRGRDFILKGGVQISSKVHDEGTVQKSMQLMNGIFINYIPYKRHK